MESMKHDISIPSYNLREKTYKRWRESPQTTLMGSEARLVYSLSNTSDEDSPKNSYGGYCLLYTHRIQIQN